MTQQVQTGLQQGTAAEPRKQAVAVAIEDIRSIESAQGVTRKSLEAIKARLIELAQDRDLFPAEDFPEIAPEQPGGGESKQRNDVHLLQEDSDGRFALYLVAGKTGTETPPHNHTTWAVITGVQGMEHNRIYRRLDDGSVPGQGRVEVEREETIVHGNAIGLMPDDIHSIHLEGEGQTMHLHMYGLGIDRLDERIAFNMEQGTYKIFPANEIKK